MNAQHGSHGVKVGLFVGQDHFHEVIVIQKEDRGYIEAILTDSGFDRQMRFDTRLRQVIHAEFGSNVWKYIVTKGIMGLIV